MSFSPAGSLPVGEELERLLAADPQPLDARLAEVELKVDAIGEIIGTIAKFFGYKRK